MMRLTGILTCLLALALATPALAEKRVALVIGNSAYVHAPSLPNPRNDAEGLAAALKRLKFEVVLGVDLDETGMRRHLREFSDRLEKAEVALVFYAGHGLQVNGRNYLVPVDAKLEKEADLVFQAVTLDQVQRLLEQGQRTSIIILDSCRNNPLARNLARSMGTRAVAIGRGLAQSQTGLGTLIVYATQPDNVALDGEGKNSPFTAALLAHIETPGIEARSMLTRVRASVVQATKSQQVPWVSESMTGDFYFAAAPAPTPPAPVSPAPPSSPSADSENLFWRSIRESKSAADYKAYLARYPQGTFAELAKIRIAELEKAAAVTPPAPEKPSPQVGPPAPTKRTSTIEVGVVLVWSGDQVLGDTREVANAQACAATCVGYSQCAGWIMHNETRSCIHLRKFTGRAPGGS